MLLRTTLNQHRITLLLSVSLLAVCDSGGADPEWDPDVVGHEIYKRSSGGVVSSWNEYTLYRSWTKKTRPDPHSFRC